MNLYYLWLFFLSWFLFSLYSQCFITWFSDASRRILCLYCHNYKECSVLLSLSIKLLWQKSWLQRSQSVILLLIPMGWSFILAFLTTFKIVEFFLIILHFTRKKIIELGSCTSSVSQKSLSYKETEESLLSYLDTTGIFVCILIVRVIFQFSAIR